MASKIVNDLNQASLPLAGADKILVSRDGINVNRATVQNVASVIASLIPTATTLTELNTNYPPASTPEGQTALVGVAGSRVEYINLNGSWQIRAVVVIGA